MNVLDKIKITAAVGAVLGLSFFAFYNKLEVNKYKIRTNKIKKGKKIRLVLISDLHSYIYKNEQDELADLIKAQNPDIIALTGDIVDDIIPIHGSKLFLQKIKGIAPTYYVTGNHEFRTGRIKEIKAMFRRYDVKVLEHSYEEIEINNEKILIAGVDDPSVSIYEKQYFDWEKQMYDSFGEFEKKQVFKILLTHRPEPIEKYKKMTFDLILSGHAHGGLIRIPFILKNGLFSTNQGFFPKYTGGLYVHDKLNHIISRGVSHKFYQPRVFNRPHVVLIEILGQK